MNYGDEDSVCGCSDEDAYCCYAERNNLGVCNADVIEENGGPCRCACHDFGDCDPQYCD